MDAGDVLLLSAIVGTGLISGFFYGWAVSALPGLAPVADRTYVQTMQSINRAILNPLFLVAFMGTPLLLGASTVVEFRSGGGASAWWVTAATATYVLGVFAVTAAGNVPLNNQLDRFVLETAPSDELVRMRSHYETRWNRLHYVRTVASVLALSFAAVAALVATR